MGWEEARGRAVLPQLPVRAFPVAPGRLLHSAHRPPWGCLVQPPPTSTPYQLHLAGAHTCRWQHLPRPCFLGLLAACPYHRPARLPFYPPPLALPWSVSRAPAVLKEHVKGMPVSGRAKAQPVGIASGALEGCRTPRILQTSTATPGWTAEREKSVGMSSSERGKWHHLR